MLDDRLPLGARESTYQFDKKELILLLGFLRRVEPLSPEEESFHKVMLEMLQNDIKDMESWETAEC